MGRPPTICHIGEASAVVGSGRMTNARRLLPFCPVYVEMRVAFGSRMHFGNFEAIGAVEPLPIDLGAADHRDLGDRTPQGIAARNRAGIIRRCRDDGPRGAIVRISRDDDVGAARQRPAQGLEGLCLLYTSPSPRD